MELQSRGKKIKINVSYTDNTLMGSKFLNDQTKYQQVLLNVLSNAVMYSPTGGTVEVSISSCVIDDNMEGMHDGVKTLLSVVVQDKGPGISQED